MHYVLLLLLLVGIMREAACMLVWQGASLECSPPTHTCAVLLLQQQCNVHCTALRATACIAMRLQVDFSLTCDVERPLQLRRV